MHHLRLLLLVIAAAVLIGLGAANAGTERAEAATTPHVASGFDYVKYPGSPALCDGVGFRFSTYWLKGVDCGAVNFQVSNVTDQDTIVVRFIGSNGKVLGSAIAAEATSTIDSSTFWRVPVKPASTWPSGAVKVDVTVFGDTQAAGQGFFYVNHLAATPTVAPSPDGMYMPGDPLLVTGTISQVTTVAAETQTLQDVAAKFYLRVVGPGGVAKGPYGPYTAAGDGTFSQGLPRSATQDFVGTYDTGYKAGISVEVIDATYTDLLTGAWAGANAGSTIVTLVTPPDRLSLENNFTSATGWVKPGDTYPFRVIVRNFMEDTISDAVVTVPPVDGTTFTQVTAAAGNGSAAINPDGSITWTLPPVPRSVDGNPTVFTLVGEGRADQLGEDPQIVWKDLSTVASVAYTGAPGAIDSKSLGPRVIPPDETFDTSRYGFRPFPVVPVDYFERKHDAAHTAEQLAAVINSPDIVGSTFNLYQEMSFGQLHPNAGVPSAGIAEAGWDVEWNSARYQESGFTFSQLTPQGACTGASFAAAQDTPLYPTRIEDGWYQMPGDTNYYGADRFTGAGSAGGAQLGVGLIFQIDDACGPTGKAVYDAAHIADPEIDYSDYDTDKDGVVDFFMMVFPGLGGNGDSLINGVPPYDNIWPHSSSLEFYFTDPVTNQPGYVSDDQLRDLEDNPLFYTDASRVTMTTNPTAYPVYVRVGPYNVNPESAIEHASVISHEYGHSLGLPDFYSHGSRGTYGDWSLMATDKSQNMDIFSKQELGWIVPRVLGPGETTVTDWHDSKYNTHRIDWVQPDGTPYTLTGPSVNNGEAYVAKLPGRQIIDPAKVIEGASPDHIWWSGSGNDYGCPPLKGHNMDIVLPDLENVPAGTPVTLTFKSYFDIEWDYDYGFVLTSTDGGQTYTSAASANGYTTPATQNPNANACQTQYGNGITGTSGSYAAGTEALDRALGDYPDGGFIEDQYDLSALAGQASVLRFTYATDPGLARPGWFIDDVKVMAGDQVIYDTDFEDAGDPRIFNGGCQEDLQSGAFCTAGWRYVNASAESPADHAYYMEMRDRSGFDFDSHGQNDRDALAFEPGMLLVYTDENHGYGNFGTDDPPAQSPLDSVPEPGNEAPNLSDAAFKPGARGHFSDAAPAGWIDNYDADPTGTALLWMFAYDCLTFDVLSMSGDGLGPATAPGDLTGTVQFNIGTGCGPFNYGLGNLPNTAPSPAATYRPADPKAGDTVTFDGSASSDDFTTRSGLIYEWDLDGDGAFEASGQVVTHAFAAAGAKNVTLRVTDAGGLSATEDIALTVLPAPATPTPPQATATVAATATPAPSGTSQEQASTQPTPRPTRTPRR